MPIIIKEIHVKSTVEQDHKKTGVSKEEISSLKKDIVSELKEFLHREYLRKNER